jgi:hypothetical protein
VIQFFASPRAWGFSFFGANFTNADNEGVFQTFSGGVIGTVVPEPSSVIMFGTGLLAVAGVVRRRIILASLPEVKGDQP